MQKTDKKTMLVHLDLLDSIEMMTDEEAGMMLKAMRAYWVEEDYQLPRELKFAFLPIKQSFDRDWQAYMQKTERNRENGQKGGRPKQSQENPKKPTGLNGNPKNPDKDNDRDKDNDKEVLGLDFTAWQSQPSQQTLADYKKTRKAKLTQTAVNRMANEINKAVAQGMTADDCLSVCCEAGWQGFKYDWYLNREKSNEKGTRSSATNKAQDYLDRLKAI